MFSISIIIYGLMSSHTQLLKGKFEGFRKDADWELFVGVRHDNGKGMTTGGIRRGF